MSSVDTRIVDMQFNNAQFNTGVQSTLQSLNNLKEGLRLDGVAENIEQVNAKLSLLGAVGFSVVNKLVDKTLSAGASIANNLFGPIIEGGKKRSLNLEQAYFQLRGLIESEEEVARIMENVSYAVDGTAYGLDAAAMAAAQFAASGIRGGTEMQNALRGISGVAAMAGSSYEDIANVFTKVAGQGRVMGDDLLRLSGRGINAAATMAKHFGTSEEAMRKMVTEGKVSFDMFSEAMNDAFGEHATKANETYTGSLMNLRAALARVGQSYFRGTDIAQSNGYFERQRKLFVALMPVINGVNEGIKKIFDSYNKLAMARRDKLVSWIESFGTKEELAKKFIPIGEQIGKTLENVSAIIKSFTTPIKEAFNDLFGDQLRNIPLLNHLLNLATAVQKFTASLVLNARAQEIVKSVATTFFSVLSIGVNALKVGWEGFKALTSILLTFFRTFWESIEPIRKAFSELLDTFIRSDGATSKIRESLRTLVDGGFKDFIVKIREIRDAVNEFTETKLAAFFRTTSEAVTPLISKLKSLGLSWNNIGKTAQSAWSKIKEVYDKLQPTLQIVTDRLKVVYDTVKKGLQELGLNGILKILAAGGLVALIKTLWDFSEGFKSVFGSVSGFIDTLKDSLFSLAETPVKKLFMLGAALLMLASALLMLSSLDMVGVAGSLGTLVASMATLLAGVWGLTRLMDGIQFKNIFALTLAFTGLAFGLLLLSVSLRIIATIPLLSLAKGLLAITLSLVASVVALKALDSKTLILGALAIGVLAASLLLLSLAIISFANVGWGTITKGLLKISMGLIVLVAALKVISKMGVHVSLGAAGLLILVMALWAFVGVLLVLKSIPFHTLIESLVSLGLSLLLLMKTLQVLGTMERDVWKVAAALIPLAAAMVIFSIAILMLSFVPFTKLAAGLIALSVGLFALIAAAKALSKLEGGSKKLLAAALAIVVLSSALVIIAGALAMVSAIPWLSLAKSVAALVAVLGSLVVGLHFLTKTSSSHIANAISLLALVGVLYTIGLALRMISQIPWTSLVKSVVAATTVIGALVIALRFMSSIKGLGFNIAYAGAMLVAAAVLYAIGLALEKIATIGWADLAIAVLAAGGVIAILTGSIFVLGSVGLYSLAGAAALLMAAGSLYLVGLALEKVAAIDWSNIEGNLITMGAALAIIAGGTLMSSFSGLGAATLLLSAVALERLAESLRAWEGLSIPTSLPVDLAKLAAGITTFTFAIAGAVGALISGMALQQVAAGLRAFSKVNIPSNLPGQLKLLSEGIRHFGAKDVLSAVAGLISGMALERLAHSVRVWDGVKVSGTIGDDLKKLAEGIKTFSAEDIMSAIAGLISGMALERLATSIKAWDGVEINPDINAQLQSLADGIGRFDDHLVGSMAALVSSFSLERMAKGVRAWEGVEVNPDIETQLKSLAKGIGAFNDTIPGSIAVFLTDGSFGRIAKGVRAWEGVEVNPDIETQLGALARGIKAFNWAFLGAFSVGYIVEPLIGLAKAARAYNEVNVPNGIEEGLSRLAGGVKKFKGMEGVAETLPIILPHIRELPEAIRGFNEIEFSDSLESSIDSLVTGLTKISKINTSDFAGKALAIFAMANALAAWSNLDLGFAMSLDLLMFSTALESFTNINISFGFTTGILLLAVAVEALGRAFASSSEDIAAQATQIQNSLSSLGATTSRVGAALGGDALRIENAINNINKALSNIGSQSAAAFTIMAGLITTQSGHMVTAVVGLNAKVSMALTLLASGVRSSAVNIVASFTQLRTSIMSQMTQMVATVNQATTLLVAALNRIAIGARSAITSASAAINAGIASIVSGAISRLYSAQGSMYSAGYQVGYSVGTGMAAGIYASGSSAISAAVSVAANALAAAKATLASNSPSKKFMELGLDMVLGMALGIRRNAHLAEVAAVNMAESTISSTLRIADELQDLLDAGIIEDPVITPVLDTSIVESQARGLGRYLDVSDTDSLATTAGLGYSSNREIAAINKALGESEVRTEVNFTQNNTSPKALSAAEIYRQTKNLVSVTKKGLDI